MKNRTAYASAKVVVLFAICFSSHLLVNAQAGFQDWEWDQYSIGFSVPSDFRVLENNAEKFSAGNSVINLTIFPRLDENLSYRQMNQALQTWANQSNVYYTSSNYMEDLNGYWGVYIDGEYNSAPVSLLLLVDPDFPENSMYIWVSYAQPYLEVATNILTSFYPI